MLDNNDKISALELCEKLRSVIEEIGRDVTGGEKEKKSALDFDILPEPKSDRFQTRHGGMEFKSSGGSWWSLAGLYCKGNKPSTSWEHRMLVDACLNAIDTCEREELKRWKEWSNVGHKSSSPQEAAYYAARNNEIPWMNACAQLLKAAAAPEAKGE